MEEEIVTAESFRHRSWLPSGPIVVHKPEWRQEALDFAAECKRLGKWFPDYSGRSREKIWTDSCLGEWSACEYFGQIPDKEVRPGGDPGWDFIVGGFRVDVKSTDLFSGKLISYQVPIVADILMLALVNTNATLLAGWIMTQRFMEDKVNENLGRGPRWTMTQRELSPVDSLESFIEEVNG
jgi:hypothetical protein